MINVQTLLEGFLEDFQTWDYFPQLLKYQNFHSISFQFKEFHCVTQMIKLRSMRRVVPVPHMEHRNAYGVLVETLDGKTRHHVKHLGIWVGSIRTHLKEIDWEHMDWINLTQDGHMAGSCKHGNEPQLL
jgi:hypothetical protein